MQETPTSMTQLAPDRDRENLNILAIFHYVMGGLTIAGSFVLLIYVAMGVIFTMLPSYVETAPTTTPSDSTREFEFLESIDAAPEPDVIQDAAPAEAATAEAEMPEPGHSAAATSTYADDSAMTEEEKQVMGFVGILMSVIGGLGFLLVMAFGILTVISGRRIARQRGRIFSLVIAGINCINFPLGTALGVFTFIMLSRDSVLRLYGETPTVRTAAS